MQVNFNVSEENKETLIKIAEEFTGKKAEYSETSHTYQIGDYEVTDEGVLNYSDEKDSDETWHKLNEALFQILISAGFEADLPEPISHPDSKENAKEAKKEANEDVISISMPRAMFDEISLQNLKLLVANKEELLKRAFKAEELPIIEDGETITFPWFHEQEGTIHYATFIQKLCEMVLTQKRINNKQTTISNEKYEFRCFLLRLGLIGNEFKETRKFLMKNLTGSAAFKTLVKKS